MQKISGNKSVKNSEVQREKCGEIKTKFRTKRINTSACLYCDVDNLVVPVKSGRRKSQ